MSRLPISGSDDGTWGDILNNYLEVSHGADGSLKANTVSTLQIQDSSITSVKLDATSQAKLAQASTALQPTNNLSDLANSTTARANLGLGEAATHSATDFDAAGSATAAQTTAESYADAQVNTEKNRALAAEAGALQKASNLSDVGDASVARQNLAAPPAALPSWATAGPTLNPVVALPSNRYDPSRGIYNWNGTNLAKMRASFARCFTDPVTGNPSGRSDVLVIGDSLMIGYNGNAGPPAHTYEAAEIPRVALKRYASLTGAQMSGTGLQRPSNVCVPTASVSDRWTYTGTVNNALYSGFSTMYAGSTLTFTPNAGEQGTVVDVVYSDLSTTFTIAIDGGAPQTVTTTGTTTVKKVSYTGLSLAAHTVKITCSSNWVFVLGAQVDVPTGIHLHNLSLGGAKAGNGDYTMNFTDTSGNSTAIGPITKQIVTALGITPDVVIVHLGGNDMQNSTDNTKGLAAINGIQTIFGWYPNASKILLSSIAVGTTTPDQWWTDFKARAYALVDTLGVSMIDMQEHWGKYATYYANGLANTTDNVHPINGAAIEIGDAIGSVLTL